jgi:predicted outer membrane protein
MSKHLLSSALDNLEEKIRSAKVVDIVFHPSVSDLRLRYLVENSKPSRTLEEMISDNQPTEKKNKHIGSSFDDYLQEEEVAEEFKTSFREVLRLAKSGQQSWWTEKLKESTNAHIECLDEYYRKNYDEKVD